MATIEAIYEEIGHNIRLARDAVGMTQEQLGQAIGLSRTSVNNIENGRQKVLVHTLFLVADVCGVAAASLLVRRGGAPHVPDDLEDWVKRVEATATHREN